jgi:hypothetical protein
MTVIIKKQAFYYDNAGKNNNEAAIPVWSISG